MKGKTCVITGATSGIGRAAALALAARGADLVLLGRDERAGLSLVRKISHGRGGRAEFMRTDLSALKEVRAAAASLMGRRPHIDVLVNNAGARHDTYRETVEGFEMTFAVNHLSHFLLTCLLLDGLKRAPQGRVITVSSGSHAAAQVDASWQLRPPAYDRKQAYAKSKLANLLFAYELADRLRDTNVTSNALDPGGVASGFALNNGLKSWLKHVVSHALRRDLVSPARAASTVVHLASSPDVAGITGTFFCRGRESRSSPASYDRDLAAELWALSLRSVGAASEQADDLGQEPSPAG